MEQAIGLLRAHAETLYVLDGSGDMVSVNEPWGSSQPRAPAFHLGWSDDSYVALFRHDVALETRQEIQSLLKSQWPFLVSPKSPPDRARYVAILGGTSRRGSGPAFATDGAPESGADALEVTPDNADVLDAGFQDWIPEIAQSRPMFAVVVGGQAVSVCRTVRRSVRGIEAGIDTVEGHRRRGYARRAVAAWCRAARREGKLGFYSTGFSNGASCALAKSLELKQFGAEFSAA